MPGRDVKLTRYHIPSIQRVIVLNEAEAIHELDLGDVSGTILEVVLDVFLGDCGIGGQRVPSEVLKTPVGAGHSITDPFEAREVDGQNLNKAEPKNYPSNVVGRPRLRSEQQKYGIMELACAYHREEDCLGRGELRRLLQTSWKAWSSSCAARS